MPKYNRWVFTSTKMINQSHLYQNKKSIALVPKIINWPKAIITLAILLTSDKTLARNKGSFLLSILESKSKIR